VPEVEFIVIGPSQKGAVALWLHRIGYADFAFIPVEAFLKREL
jgi:hypothetical protein